VEGVDGRFGRDSFLCASCHKQCQEGGVLSPGLSLHSRYYPYYLCTIQTTSNWCTPPPSCLPSVVHHEVESSLRVDKVFSNRIMEVDSLKLVDCKIYIQGSTGSSWETSCGARSYPYPWEPNCNPEKQFIMLYQGGWNWNHELEAIPRSVPELIPHLESPGLWCPCPLLSTLL
jgi:hypothetical protein